MRMPAPAYCAVSVTCRPDFDRSPVQALVPARMAAIVRANGAPPWMPPWNRTKPVAG